MRYPRRSVVLLALPGLMAPALLQAAMMPPVPQTDSAYDISEARLVQAAAQQGYLGVHVRDVDPERVEKQKLNAPVGAEVVSLDHDAPAAKAGVHTGDVIQALNGQLVSDAATLTRLLRDMPVGKFINLQIMHNAKVEMLHLQLGDRTALVQHAWSHHFRVPIPEPAPMVEGFASQRNYYGGSPAANSNTPDAQGYVGAMVEPLTPQLAKFFGVHAGNGLLVNTVEDKSPASNAGIEAGDVILSANGMALETTADWLQTLRTNAGHPVALVVLRNRKVLTLAITVDPRITQSEWMVPKDLQRLRESLDRYSL